MLYEKYKNTTIWSGGDSFVVLGGPLASCRLSVGVGVAVPKAGAGIAVAEDDSVDTPTNAYKCMYCAWRAAAVRSALALAWSSSQGTSQCTVYGHRRHLEPGSEHDKIVTSA
jgi:hypothetical protein